MSTMWEGSLPAIGHQFWIIGDVWTDLMSLDYTKPESVLTSPDLAAVISPAEVADDNDVTVTLILADTPADDTTLPTVTYTKPATVMLTDGSLPTDQLKDVHLPPGDYRIKESVTETDTNYHHTVTFYPTRK